MKPERVWEECHRHGYPYADLRLNMQILLTTQVPKKRPPLFRPLHWHVQPQLVEINDLQPVEINNSMNATTC